jgi:DNA polymerase V
MQEIAHVDVNCFYASAERAFNPALEGRPVIVLSNYVPRNITVLLCPA